MGAPQDVGLRKEHYDGSAARDRGNNTHFIAVLEFCLDAIQEANIFTVDIEIHETSQLTLIITQASFDAGTARFQRIQKPSNVSSPLTLQRCLTTRQFLQGGGN